MQNEKLPLPLPPLSYDQLQIELEHAARAPLEYAQLQSIREHSARTRQYYTDQRVEREAKFAACMETVARGKALMAETRAIQAEILPPHAFIVAPAASASVLLMAMHLALYTGGATVCKTTQLGTVNVLGRCANIVPRCENIFVGPVLIGELVYECKVCVSCASLPLDVVVRVGDVLSFDAECCVINSGADGSGDTLGMSASNVRNLHLVNKK